MLVKQLGLVPYTDTYQAMQDFTALRTAETGDELWLCEHPPVFTQGLAGLANHVLNPGTTPVIATNRGGQVTYHGPGQVMAYPLLNLQRRGYFVKEYVYRLEESVIRTLAHFGVTGHRVANAPGIYVRMADPFAHTALTGPVSPNDPFKGLGKISALGIKVSRHCSYHGLALNVKMDLEPFQRINPCGYAGLQSVDLFTIGINTSWEEAADVLAHKLSALLAP
ncbi:lipoyl(octanoyl) transferase LipB [Limnohabitans sp. MMS-10A-178]|jgi:lipoyl(octanoyl) transferase|uniref:lipoyl(octanoyl) transferase LipB n=1 Tax=Limnohabitans sp. MMS-10A-178 TaxID=1835767 RepID=UPI000D3DC68A|nr:lipoyl(octanoyl) transferase LipB [Limnohabitans sp. MMS-10A-178]PUE16338.1 lipoate--protein ligase [Limnohabitans sp. MMS-10A-178]